MQYFCKKLHWRECGNVIAEAKIYRSTSSSHKNFFENICISWLNNNSFSRKKTGCSKCEFSKTQKFLRKPSTLKKISTKLLGFNFRASFNFFRRNNPINVFASGERNWVRIPAARSREERVRVKWLLLWVVRAQQPNRGKSFETFGGRNRCRRANWCWILFYDGSHLRECFLSVFLARHEGRLEQVSGEQFLNFDVASRKIIGEYAERMESAQDWGQCLGGGEGEKVENPSRGVRAGMVLRWFSAESLKIGVFGGWK